MIFLWLRKYNLNSLMTLRWEYFYVQSPAPSSSVISRSIYAVKTATLFRLMPFRAEQALALFLQTFFELPSQ